MKMGGSGIVVIAAREEMLLTNTIVQTRDSRLHHVRKFNVGIGKNGNSE